MAQTAWVARLCRQCESRAQGSQQQMLAPVVMQLHQLWEVVSHHLGQQHCRRKQGRAAHQPHVSARDASRRDAAAAAPRRRCTVPTSISKVPGNVALGPRERDLIHLRATVGRHEQHSSGAPPQHAGATQHSCQLLAACPQQQQHGAPTQVYRVCSSSSHTSIAACVRTGGEGGLLPRSSAELLHAAPRRPSVCRVVKLA